MEVLHNKCATNPGFGNVELVNIEVRDYFPHWQQRLASDFPDFKRDTAALFEGQLRQSGRGGLATNAGGKSRLSLRALERKVRGP